MMNPEDMTDEEPARKTVRTKTGRGRKLVRHETEVAIPTTRGRTVSRKIVRRKASTAPRRFTRPGDGLYIVSSPKRATRKRRPAKRSD